MQSVRTLGNSFVSETKVDRMLSLKCCLLLCVFCSFALRSVPSFAQESTTIRNSTALTFLSQVVSAAGGTSALSAVQDFTAQGLITHFWNDNPEQGQVTIKSRGFGQFRLDSNVPEGTWSYIVNNGVGEIHASDGRVSKIAYHNNFNSGSLTWPITKLVTAMIDPSTSVIDLGMVRLGNATGRHLRIQQVFRSGDSSNRRSNLSRRDYIFDPSAFVLLRVQDELHPDNDAFHGALVHTLDFGNYRVVNGISVPFSIRESISGQHTWNIQLSSVAFNTGLGDSDFQF